MWCHDYKHALPVKNSWRSFIKNNKSSRGCDALLVPELGSVAGI
jgi:hypothetical protein